MVAVMQMPVQGAGASRQSRWMETSLLIGGEVLRRWHCTGSAQGLSSDSEIAAFLLNL